MATTIQVSKELLSELKQRKAYDKESYEEVIWDLIEDVMLLSKETKKELEIARKEIREGKFVTLEQLKQGTEA